MLEEWQNFEIVCFITMQDEHLRFWSFSIFFRVLYYTGNNLSTLNQAFINQTFHEI